jgi:hypothetical protein
MKMAVPSLSKDALLAWLLDHCEKLIGGVVLLLSLWLAWSGLSAMRTKSAPAELRPDKISSQANAALAHIDDQPEPPEDKLLEPRGLADSIATWIAPGEKDPRKPVFSRPLFDELARRAQPDVFPVEDLRAVAGVAVVAVPVDPGEAGGRQPRPGPRPPRPGDPLVGGVPGDFGPGVVEPDPAVSVPPARIVPYVIVTGLIPYAKQIDEYFVRFENASFRDLRRDAPLWSDFLIERADVTNGPDGKWERLNPKVAAQAMQKEWAGVQADLLPAEFFLSAEEQPGLGDIVYAWPLPQLAMESWGPEAVHPWATTEWQRMVSEQAAMGIQGGNPMQPVGPATMPFAGGGQLPPGLDSPLGGSALGMEPPLDPLAGADDGVMRLDYKLFRFVDTAVKPGHRYRYRVRLSVWNPNYQVPAQHLAEADLANATKLPSPPSNETAAVPVPGMMNVLARMLPTEPKQRGIAEVLVLWPHEKTGNYSLHSVPAAAGGIISLQRQVEQQDDDPGKGRPGKGKQEPAIDLVPVGMLVDFMGQQASSPGGQKPPTGRRGKKASPPAEPFELLVLGDDGELKWTNPIDSEERYLLYVTTLPVALRGLPADQMGPAGMPNESMFPGFPGIK